MPSVQFRSMKDVISAFRNTDCEAWSLWDGKRYMFKGIGYDDLESFLKLLDESGASNTVYTIAYYEGITEKKDINSKIGYDGSFNFLLSKERDDETSDARTRTLRSQVNGLENKFDLLLEKLSETEPEPENKLGVIGDILNHPAVAPILPVLAQKIVDSVLRSGQSASAGPVHQISGLGKVAGIGNILEQDQALELSIETLLKHDARLPEHLAKLALLAERDPATFAFIMKQLDSMQTE